MRAATPNYKSVAALASLALNEERGVRIITPEPETFKRYFRDIRKEEGSPFAGLTCRNDPDDPHNAVFLVHAELLNRFAAQAPNVSETFVPEPDPEEPSDGEQ